MPNRYCPSCYEVITEEQHAKGSCPHCGKMLPALMISLPSSRPGQRSEERYVQHVESDAPLTPIVMREPDRKVEKLLAWARFQTVLLILIISIAISLFQTLFWFARQFEIWPFNLDHAVHSEIYSLSFFITNSVFVLTCILMILAPRREPVRPWGVMSFIVGLLLVLLLIIYTIDKAREHVEARGFGAPGRVNNPNQRREERRILSGAVGRWVSRAVWGLGALALGLVVIQTAKRFGRNGLAIAYIVYLCLHFLRWLLSGLLIEMLINNQQPFSRMGALLDITGYVRFGLMVWELVMVILIRRACVKGTALLGA